MSEAADAAAEAPTADVEPQTDETAESPTATRLPPPPVPISMQEKALRLNERTLTRAIADQAIADAVEQHQLATSAARISACELRLDALETTLADRVAKLEAVAARPPPPPPVTAEQFTIMQASLEEFKAVAQATSQQQLALMETVDALCEENASLRAAVGSYDPTAGRRNEQEYNSHQQAARGVLLGGGCGVATAAAEEPKPTATAVPTGLSYESAVAMNMVSPMQTSPTGSAGASARSTSPPPPVFDGHRQRIQALVSKAKKSTMNVSAAVGGNQVSDELDALKESVAKVEEGLKNALDDRVKRSEFEALAEALRDVRDKGRHLSGANEWESLPVAPDSSMAKALSELRAEQKEALNGLLALKGNLLALSSKVDHNENVRSRQPHPMSLQVGVEESLSRSEGLNGRLLALEERIEQSSREIADALAFKVDRTLLSSKADKTFTEASLSRFAQEIARQMDGMSEEVESSRASTLADLNKMLNTSLAKISNAVNEKVDALAQKMERTSAGEEQGASAAQEGQPPSTPGMNAPHTSPRGGSRPGSAFSVRGSGSAAPPPTRPTSAQSVSSCQGGGGGAYSKPQMSIDVDYDDLEGDMNGWPAGAGLLTVQKKQRSQTSSAGNRGYRHGMMRGANRGLATRPGGNLLEQGYNACMIGTTASAVSGQQQMQGSSSSIQPPTLGFNPVHSNTHFAPSRPTGVVTPGELELSRSRPTSAAKQTGKIGGARGMGGSVSASGLLTTQHATQA